MKKSDKAKLSNSQPVRVRATGIKDHAAICGIEQECFVGDRLSSRRIRHWIGADNGILRVAEDAQGLLGYGLVLLRKDSAVARLYSLAVTQRARGMGLGQRLMQQLEKAAAQKSREYMRLEVARGNHAAIKLYESLGYAVIGIYKDYYEDHQDALRMQKQLKLGSV